MTGARHHLGGRPRAQFGRALAIVEAAYGPDHTAVAAARNQLASLAASEREREATDSSTAH